MMTAAQPITMTDPRLDEFLTLWHENGRECFVNSYANLDYDSPAYAKTATDRGKKFIAVDEGTSGAFLLEKATGDVWTIKAYGVKNRKIGTLDELIAAYRAANEQNRAFHARYMRSL